MSKQLKFDWEGVDYTLEYTRATVREMEMAGFDAEELVKKANTLIPQLFAGAFKAHHRYVKPSVIQDIFDHIGNRGELLAKLVEMYRAPLEDLMSDPELEDESKKVSWEANW